ncbi:MAG: protein kinase [Deltaproteobacteria bacterium]|nr:protein kinase [Deltaproteobacteria bacterium]
MDERPGDIEEAKQTAAPSLPVAAPHVGEAVWVPPAEFDGYRIGRLLGRGSMGQVYLAHDTLLDRSVAAKFIDVPALDAISRERFLTEARAVARLQHPNVVAIYRVGEVGGRPYLISEFIRGKALDELPLPQSPADVLSIGLGLARGLAAAHRRGVVHRDIKPANALMAPTGEVKLLDFGLAELLDSATKDSSTESVPSAAEPLVAPSEGGPDSATLTHGGGWMGTPAYMAPEVWCGQPATFRSDIYSLGAVLYELCAGRAPHERPSLSQLRAAVLQEEPRPLQELSAIDPRLAAVITRCLSKDPVRRYATAEYLREALETLLPSARGAAIPVGNPYRGLRAFEAEHRALFFGRDPEIRAIAERLRTEPFLLVAGMSGVGKSSLCRAGVIPTIQEGGLADGRTWKHAILTPGRHPVAALAEALAPCLKEDEEVLAGRIRGEWETVGHALRRAQGQGQGLLLFIDQLEELATLSDPEEATAVGEALGWLSVHTASLRLLCTVRGDFLDRVASIPGLGDSVTRALHLLRPLSSEGIRQAITGPAQAKQVEFESEAMVDELTDSCARTEGGLPLLQFALAELWEVRDKQRQLITASALQEVGGVTGALARHGDAVLAGLIPAQRKAARRMLPLLVTLEMTRARRTEEELGANDPNARSALDALVRGRLLVAGDAAEGSAYEVAHEALIHGWPTLRRWLEEDADVRALRERLFQAIAEWERMARRREGLWSTRQLAEISILDPHELTARERAFIDASHKAMRARRTWRTVLLVGGVLAAAGTYGGIRLEAKLALDRKVAAAVAGAEQVLAAGRESHSRSDQLRQEAFSLFDAQDAAQGEASWSKAAKAAAQAEQAYSSANQQLEAAIALGGRQDEARRALSLVLHQRALLAERERRLGQRDELIARLKLYDGDGSLQAQWSASAHLSLATSPEGAKVQLIPLTTSPEGARTEGEPMPQRPSPITRATLSPGSWIAVVSAPGKATVRLPFLARRGEEVKASIALLDEAAVPAGFAYVPAGRFLFGSAAADRVRRDFFHTVPMHEVSLPGYFIARTEATFGEWLEYLRSLSPSERAKRFPGLGSAGFQGALQLKQTKAAGWELSIQPTTRAYTAGEGEKIRYDGRKTRAEHDWTRLPASGITLQAAQDYAAWLDSTGRVPRARLCTEQEWERAARGADDREYPHGDLLEPDDANYDETYGKEPLAMGPDEVGSHPRSRSPFGLDDLMGNVWEWTRSSMSPGEHLARGGSYYFGTISGNSTNRELVEPSLQDLSVGTRVCADLPR